MVLEGMKNWSMVVSEDKSRDQNGCLCRYITLITLVEIIHTIDLVNPQDGDDGDYSFTTDHDK